MILGVILLPLRWGYIKNRMFILDILIHLILGNIKTYLADSVISYIFYNMSNLHAHFVPCGLYLLLSFWSLVRSVLCLRGWDDFLFCFFFQRSWSFVRRRWRYVMSKGGPGSCQMHSLHRMLNQSQRGKERRSDSHQGPCYHKNTKNIARIKLENQGLRSEDNKWVNQSQGL